MDKLDEIMTGKPGWQTGLMTVTDAGWPVSRPLPPPPPPAPPPAPPEPKPGPGPKAVLFVLDCSGSMSGSRINSCKQALGDIYNDNLSDTDQLALVTFASDVRVDLGWTMKAGSEGRVPQLFRSLTTRGATEMFAGIQRAIDMTKQCPRMVDFDNWIVLLCDGAITIVSVCLPVCPSACVSPVADVADDFCLCVVRVM